ncbi:phosphoadenosine phosphosulfate reductase family protein [Romboutsia sedimentorum]|uniref:phosphoadenosine phosphosulfate reductase domain-containing protein n=1 Tax=Romboutsia sedimentorum TaxID=1368474 RepID=UPI0024DE8941|nr:phosphoadenosine phosphosulfate reductase family protein [Romboutsia sedimentorum]MDK2584456.1 phosphoadenosine phosphosulfate reductase family protein [Romboutsia sedimentorum]
MENIKEINIYYCDKCKTPILVEDQTKHCRCTMCNSQIRYTGTDARPVYPEERLMLEASIGEPLKYIKDDVWNLKGNKYLVNGEILKLQVRDIVSNNPEEVRNIINQYASKNTYKYFNKHIAKFIEANKYRLNIITDEACDFIEEKSKGYDIDSMFVSFSGGKDSTVVAHLVVKALCTTDVLHIFGDTTLELESTYEYVKGFKRENPNILMRAVKNKEKDFIDLTVNNFGPPSRVMRWCCTIFKTGPISRKIDALFKNKKEVLTFYGIRRSESINRSKYERDYESPKIIKQRVVGPIMDWKDIDVWLYLLSNDILINDAYRMGYSRVGCWCCPNNSSWSEYMSKIYEPHRYKEWRKILVEFAAKIGKPDPEDYISEGGWKARQGGNGLDVSKTKLSAEVCTTQENAKIYALKRPIEDQLYELFKPFGLIDKESGRRFINEVLVIDKRTSQPIISIEGNIGSNKLKVVILDKKNPKLLKKRVECQITKYQLCMECLACESLCKFDALKIKNGKYTIDEKKCSRCLECVAHFTGGCYIKKILYTKKQEE